MYIPSINSFTPTCLLHYLHKFFTLFTTAPPSGGLLGSTHRAVVQGTMAYSPSHTIPAAPFPLTAAMATSTVSHQLSSPLCQGPHNRERGAGESCCLCPSLCLFLQPELLVLLAPKALVIVAFALEELLEVWLAVEFSMKSCITAQAGKKKGRKRHM